MRGRSAPSVNVGPLISRKPLELESQNFNTHLDGANYAFQVWQFFRWERVEKGAAPLV